MIFNILVVGLGNIGMLYDYDRTDVTWTHVNAIMKDDRFNLVSGIDRNKENRKKFYDLTGVTAHTDLEEVMENIDNDIHIVVIACPTELHVEIYIQIKRFSKKCNCRLVVMEKPISDSQTQLDNLIIEKKDGPEIIVNLFRLYQDNLNQCIKKLSKSGECNVSITYSKGLVHNGIHFVSLLLRHFGEDNIVSSELPTSNESIKYIFNGTEITMTKSVSDIDNNSMIINSSEGSLYYLNGGRHSFYIDKNHVKQNLSKPEFDHYQSGVYNSVYDHLINSKKDDSFKLAMVSQRLLELSERE